MIENISTELMLAGFVGVGYIAAQRWINRGKKEQKSIAEKKDAASPGPAVSLRDPVTDLYDKNHLYRRLNEHIAFCSRKVQQMAVVIWDIDGFMDFNNKFGRAAGDRLLKKVGEVIRGSIRIYDEAFRSGPDEFCGVLIPGDEAVAAEVMLRVSEAVSRNLFEGDREFAGHSFSISSGVVYFPGEQHLPEALLHAARQSLYRKQVNKPADPT